MESPERPSFVWIVMDDMTAGQLDAMPLTRGTLSQGAVFTNAHCAIPQCSPSRASMQTGRYPSNTGMFGNKGSARRFRDRGLALRSYPHLLREAGYRSAMYGKHLNDYQSVAGWVAPGFDRWVCTLVDRNPTTANRQGAVRKLRHVSGPRAGEWVWRNSESEFLCAQAADWMDGQQDPFCLTLGLSAPHDPYTPEPEDIGDYAGVAMPKTAAFDHDDPGKPGYVRRPPLTEAEKTQYENEWRGSMEELKGADRRIAAMLSGVDFEKTYVFFCSDNAYCYGQHRRHRKQVPYGASTNVPLMVRGPGIEPKTSDALVSLIDVTATIAELGGIDGAWPEDSPLDGRSLSPLLFADGNGAAEEGGEAAWRSSLLIEQGQEYGPQYGEWEAVLSTGGELYVEHLKTGEREYYPASDPLQLTNVAAERLERADELAARLRGLSGAAGGELRAAETAGT